MYKNNDRNHTCYHNDTYIFCFSDHSRNILGLKIIIISTIVLIFIGNNISAYSLKQQSAGRHVAPLRHIIMIVSLPVFALTPLCRVLCGEATNIGNNIDINLYNVLNGLS
jgi:uncharacterized membrane protein